MQANRRAGYSERNPAGEGPRNPWELQVCVKIRPPSRERGMEEREPKTQHCAPHLPQRVCENGDRLPVGARTFPQVTCLLTVEHCSPSQEELQAGLEKRLRV